MKKALLTQLLGSQQAIADLLGVTKGAVSQWPEEIPRLRQYQLREKIPDLDRQLEALQEQAA